MTDPQQQLRDLVKKAIQAAVPADQMVERKHRPDSDYTWCEPSPRAGLDAALQVLAIAQRQAYDSVLGLRAEGVSWDQAADLLGIEWSEDYVRRERAYELVLGPTPKDSSPWRDRTLYWYCAGPLGCGEFITDRGPYNGYPSDCEDGHADGCRRHAAEIKAHADEQDRAEERARIMDQASKDLAGHHFAEETVKRARYVQAHGGRYLGWSTSENLAVALALNDDERLNEWGSRESAIDRVFQGTSTPPEGIPWWLATVRAAATGETDTAA